MELGKLTKPYRIQHGRHFRLKDFGPADTAGWRPKQMERALQECVETTAELQDRLFAQDRWALLVIFQGIDAAGKDGAIKHVMSGLNPQACQVFAFKEPSQLELNHDFLWRTTINLPERGHIGVFNRSYYEEVLVVRVHPELLRNEKLPTSLVTKRLWKERYEDIRNFESHVTREGTVIRKFFLHVSKEEQRQRFLARLEEPEKNWKFSASDAREREFWDDYQDAYEDMIRHTSTAEAPWYVVPADNKDFTRLVISTVLVETLNELKLSYPSVPAAERKELEAAKQELLRNK
jgi:PPK2 family polyphosphate:nucleotide phosphotransferase